MFVRSLAVCARARVFARSCVCLSVDPSERMFIFAVQYAEAHITDWEITTEPDDMAGKALVQPLRPGLKLLKLPRVSLLHDWFIHFNYY